MTKSPLILPSDPAFYELPPPPGSTPEPSLEDQLAELAVDADPDDGDVQEDAVPVIAGSCDSHVHVFPDPERFPHAEAAPYRPAIRSAEEYARLRRRLGLERAVVVHSSVHGFDHAALLDTLEQLGSETVRGVAAVGPGVSDQELDDLAGAGCVATRFQMRDPWRLIDWADTDRLAGRVFDRVRWDVELQMDGRFLMEVEDRLRSWPGRVVLDHIGCFLGPVSDRDPGLRALLRLIDADKVWVKLCGPEESDPQAPRYPHAERIARQLIRFAPERLVWGSNWPHPNAFEAPLADARLLELLGEWCEDSGLRDRILIDNACALWGFTPPDRPESPDRPASGTKS
jgi:D-galactarolactone isomerase